MHSKVKSHKRKGRNVKSHNRKKKNGKKSCGSDSGKKYEAMKKSLDDQGIRKSPKMHNY